MKKTKKQEKKRFGARFGFGSVSKVLNEWYDNFAHTMGNLLNQESDEIVIEDRKVKAGATSAQNLHRPGRFINTSLPLIPDIRKSSTELGERNQFLGLFGISVRVGSKVKLEKGPNKRANRYLVYMYLKMLRAIFGTITFVYASKVDPETKAKVKRSHPVRVDYSKVLKSVDVKKCTRKERKDFNKRMRLFWALGLCLLRKSNAFQTAVLMKVLGRVGRWFHRDKTLKEISYLHKTFSRIVANFNGAIPVRRKWINSVESMPSKWRPLGIAPLAWRIYTRGVANLLETFLASSWPSNQHAYTTGRGVNTAWKEILSTVIHYKNIYEYDFSGFFNTINITAVGKMLLYNKVPKFMVIHLMALCGSEVTNEKPAAFVEHLRDTFALDTFASAWTKHEYIHKYRRGWRSRGLPQGFSLAPILSVLPLIVLDELKDELNINNISYADDGLFYSEHSADVDYLGLAQAVLDKWGIGAQFNMSKSKPVKKNGVWLSPLKFVGLVYDPWREVLSAATRSGSKIPLLITVIAKFASKPNEEVARDKLEKVIVESGEMYDLLSPYYATVTTRGHEYCYKSILENIYPASCTLPNSEKFDIAAKLLRERRRCIAGLGKEECDKCLRDLAFWAPLYMMLDLDPDRAHEFIREWGLRKRLAWLMEFYQAILKTEIRYLEKPEAVKLDINNIVDLRILENPPAMSNYSWAIDPRKIPVFGEFEQIDYIASEEEAAECKSGAIKYGIGRICWQNTLLTPYFDTFIACLFKGSFSSEDIVQSFRLDREEESVVWWLAKAVGPGSLWKAMGGGAEGYHMNTFNSTSVSSNALMHWLKKTNHLARAKFVNPVAAAYQSLFEKLLTRRSDVSRKALSKYLINVSYPKKKRLLEELGQEATDLIYKYPMDPYECTYPKDSVRKYMKGRLAAFMRGVQTETILNSTVSEHIYRWNPGYKKWGPRHPLYVFYYTLAVCELKKTMEIVPEVKPRQVNWFTIAPYTKGPRGG